MMLFLLATVVIAACAAAFALAVARRRQRAYQLLLQECIERQPEHELEHRHAHGGHFSAALRIENLARRFERKIHAAGLPPLPAKERTRRAKEALWQRG